MTTEAKNLKVGDKYKSGSTIQEVTKIVNVTDLAITYRTKRIFPDVYGDFFNRKNLSTKVEIQN